MISPAGNISDANGTTTVKITAKPYGTDTGVEMKVSVLNSAGTTVSSQSVTLDSNEKEYVLVLSGAADNSKIKIENTTTKKRVLLAAAKIYSGDASGEANARRKAEESGDANQRTITGITDTCYTLTGLTPGANYTYKVKAIYIDESESDWSESKTVKLAAETLVGDINGNGIVDVSDVTALVNAILNSTTDSVCDVDANGEVNVSDVTTLVNIILQ